MLLPIPPLLFLICCLAMLALHQWLPILVLFSIPDNLLGLLPLGIGFAISLRGAWQFVAEKTNLHAFKEPDLLVVSGIFRFTRNPMYLGLTLALGSIAILLGGLSAWLPAILFFAVADRCYIPQEERAMSDKFGDAYQDYQSQTRRWI